MVGVIAAIVSLFILLGACNSITAEKFNKALRKQQDNWNQ